MRPLFSHPAIKNRAVIPLKPIDDDASKVLGIVQKISNRNDVSYVVVGLDPQNFPSLPSYWFSGTVSLADLSMDQGKLRGDISAASDQYKIATQKYEEVKNFSDEITKERAENELLKAETILEMKRMAYMIVTGEPVHEMRDID